MIESVFGIKIHSIVAGISGSIVSLLFEEKLSFFRAVLLTFTGGTTAGYFSSYLEHTWSLSHASVGFYAFLAGLTAIRVIKVLFALLDKAQKNPMVLAQFIPFIRLNYDNNLSNISDSTSAGSDLDNARAPTKVDSEE